MTAMRQREYEWLAWREGTIDTAMFEAYSGVVPTILGTERTRAWWAHYSHGFFASGFVDFVDQMLMEAPLTDYWDSLDKW